MFTKAISATRWLRFLGLTGLNGGGRFGQDGGRMDLLGAAAANKWPVPSGDGALHTFWSRPGFWHTAEHRQTLITYRKPVACQWKFEGVCGARRVQERGRMDGRQLAISQLAILSAALSCSSRRMLISVRHPNLFRSMPHHSDVLASWQPSRSGGRVEAGIRTGLASGE